MPGKDSPIHRAKFPMHRHGVPTGVHLSRRVMTRRTITGTEVTNVVKPARPVVVTRAIIAPVKVAKETYEIYQMPVLDKAIEEMPLANVGEPISVVIDKKSRKKRK